MRRQQQQQYYVRTAGQANCSQHRIASQACACVHEPEYAQALPCPWEMFDDDDVDWMDGDMNDDRATGGVNWVAPWERQARQTALSSCRLPSAHPLPLPFRCVSTDHGKPTNQPPNVALRLRQPCALSCQTQSQDTEEEN